MFLVNNNNIIINGTCFQPNSSIRKKNNNSEEFPGFRENVSEVTSLAKATSIMYELCTFRYIPLREQ
jgi:hypothetical protein